MINRCHRVMLSIIVLIAVGFAVWAKSETSGKEQLLTIFTCGAAMVFSVMALTDVFLYGVMRIYDFLKSKWEI